MSRFTVILPEGTVILKNEETGQILRLSAESGPLVLGEIEMSMTLGPRPLEVAGAAHAPAVAAAQAPACELPARPADPLADLLIVSQVRVTVGDALSVTVAPAQGVKCARCWKVLTSVGTVAGHDTLCPRCAAVVKALPVVE